MRQTAREQFVREHAHGVHIRGGRHRLSQDLFRRGIVRRQHAHFGERWIAERIIVGEQFCDAEVEQLHLAVRGDEDVRGFEVAVDDELAVRS